MANYTIELRTILSSRDIFKAINYDFYEEAYRTIFEEKFIKRFDFMGDKLTFIDNYNTQLENYESYKEFNKLLDGLNDELKLYIELERPELTSANIIWFDNKLIELKKVIKEQGGELCENY